MYLFIFVLPTLLPHPSFILTNSTLSLKTKQNKTNKQKQKQRSAVCYGKYSRMHSFCWSMINLPRAIPLKKTDS